MYTKHSVEIDGSPMEILVFVPEGDGPHPGIVVAQHLPVAHMGLERDPFTIGVGNRLAPAGYACAIPYHLPLVAAGRGYRGQARPMARRPDRRRPRRRLRAARRH